MAAGAAESSEGLTMKAGDVVYTVNGQEAIYVADGGDYVIVRPLLEYERPDGEIVQLRGELTGVPEVFDKPPRQRLDEEIQRLQALAQAQRKELTEVARQVSEAKKGHEDVLARLKQHDALRRIDDVIAGKVKWAVTVDYSGVHVQPIEKVIASGDRFDYRDGLFKLVSLYGGSKGDLGWRVNNYADDSGSSQEVWLFVTEEEAHEKAKEFFDVGVKEWRAARAECLRQKKDNAWTRACNWVMNGMFDPPQDLWEYVKDHDLGGLYKRVDERKLQLQQAVEELAAARQKWAARRWVDQ